MKLVQINLMLFLLLKVKIWAERLGGIQEKTLAGFFNYLNNIKLELKGYKR